MSRFTDEIAEIPSALRRLVAFYRGDGRARLDDWGDFARSKAGVLFAGMGSSEFAPMTVTGRMSGLGAKCSVADAGEWLHYGADTDGRGVVLVSQSGESVEARRIIESGLAGDGFTAITNDERSAVGRAASLVLPLCAGTEAAIAAKTYTNSLALVKLMAAALEGHPATESVLESLERAASVILDVDDGHIGAAAERLLPGHAVAFVGRGPAYASARQCALTFIEGARGLAAAFTGGGFRHGPMELAGPELRAVFLAPEGVTRDIMAGLASEAAAHGAGVVVITDSDVAPADGAAVVRVPRADRGGEELFPLAVSGAHALLLDRFAAARGIEAGHFVRGSKVTSKE